MKLHFDNDWLRKRIESDGDVEIEAAAPELLLSELGFFMHEGLVRTPSATAGATATRSADDDNVVDLASRRAERDMHYAFGLYVQLKRKEQGLTRADLASRAKIDEEELGSIERDPHHVPRPRTVTQLASFFRDDVKKLMRLSGVIQGRDEVLEEAALKFAAMSDDLARLDKEERALLNEFVKLLKE
jgi:transcriptional regulator with XRE-family HTH domain